ncbi:protein DETOXIFICATION 41-like [Argentina anserina]|uniref:protein DETOXIFICATION 41-like n=1 Tax=Argentina anserina TaxID=57926 RepID=UPI0021765607|nr:protein DETOXIFICATION 41-like [Potentilla anserina]
MESGENRPLLLGHELESRISDLSSTAIEELLEQPPPTPVLYRLPRLLVWESRLIFHVSTSSIIAGVFNNLLGFATLTLCSQLSIVELAGASIANLVILGLVNGIMLGIASAVPTVCAQAYGAKQYAAMGVMCQRAIILHLGAAVLLTFLCWWSSPILVAMGVSDIIAGQAQLFTRGLIPQLYALAINYPQQRFLQSQSLVIPLALIAVVTFGIHLVCTWLVLNVYHYGVMGAALTLSFSWWLVVLLCGIYIGFSSKCKETWTGFSWKALTGMWPYFKLTIASAIMLCLEILYFQVVLLISWVHWNTVSLESICICMNYWNWILQFLLGLNAAGSVRMGNELGAGHPRVAKFSLFLVNVNSLVISLIFTVLVLIFSVRLSRLFTTEAEALVAVSDLIPMLAISIFFNGIQPILSGVAVGTEWRIVVAYINLLFYYIIGTIIGFGWQAGLWWGMVIGFFVETATVIILTARTNWNVEVVNVADRMKNMCN